MWQSSGQIGSLRVHQIQTEDKAPKALVVLCHGFGAPGTDLVSLAPELIRAAPRVIAGFDLHEVRFAFPEAPLDLAEIGFFGARAWFPIDVAAIGSPERILNLAKAEPAGMAQAREALAATIAELLSANQLGYDRLILGGFSQGSMMALDLALRLPEGPLAVLAYSPTLVDRPLWEAKAKAKAGLTVLIAHGRDDQILPFAATEGLVDLLRSCGIAVQFVPFDGPHTISGEGLRETLVLLHRLL